MFLFSQVSMSEEPLTVVHMDRDVLALAGVGGAVISPRLAHAAGPQHDAAGEVVRVRLAPGLRPKMGLYKNICAIEYYALWKQTMSET